MKPSDESQVTRIGVEVVDSWAVVDKWWRDEAEWERREYRVIVRDGEHVEQKRELEPVETEWEDCRAPV